MNANWLIALGVALILAGLGVRVRVDPPAGLQGGVVTEALGFLVISIGLLMRRKRAAGLAFGIVAVGLWSVVVTPFGYELFRDPLLHFQLLFERLLDSGSKTNAADDKPPKPAECEITVGASSGKDVRFVCRGLPFRKHILVQIPVRPNFDGCVGSRTQVVLATTLWGGKPVKTTHDTMSAVWDEPTNVYSIRAEGFSSFGFLTGRITVDSCFHDRSNSCMNRDCSVNPGRTLNYIPAPMTWQTL